jgi:hypothetical protein
MDELFVKHRKKLQLVDASFIRKTTDNIHWQDRLIGIKGARGIGKTTLVLQYVKQNFEPGHNNLYVSLDDIYFSGNRLIDFAKSFVQNGGEHLFLDEVHRYPDWAQELKNIYDDYPELKIVFTGSSILDIVKAKADLSRRAIIYKMQGLSFREYLSLAKNVLFRTYSLSELLHHHESIADEICKTIKPLAEFKDYLQFGYYPFFKEFRETYGLRLEQVLNTVLETDIPSMKSMNYGAIRKLKQLLYIISTSVPFKPNITKLSQKTGISRNSLIMYLRYLEEASVLLLLNKDSKGISLLQKPEKVYLENTNLIYSLSKDNANIGNIRETFFINQLTNKHHVSYSFESDFLIDNKYTFEIGGGNKTRKQIMELEDAFVVVDNVEIGFKNKIPLWLFGFLY